MPALGDLQAQVLRAVLDGELDASELLKGAYAAERLGVYAGSAAANFERALRLGFPVVARLVGDEYFGRCAHEYQRVHPSRCGNLQQSGDRFADFLNVLHGADEHRYLADVARFEWLRQVCAGAAEHAPLDLAELAAIPPGWYPGLRFSLHPALRFFHSAYPVLAIWEANVTKSSDAVIDLDEGADRLLLIRRRGAVECLRLTIGEHRFMQELRNGSRLAAALAAAARCDIDFDGVAALQRFVLAGAIVEFHRQNT